MRAFEHAYVRISLSLVQDKLCVHMCIVRQVSGKMLWLISLHTIPVNLFNLLHYEIVNGVFLAWIVLEMSMPIFSVIKQKRGEKGQGRELECVYLWLRTLSRTALKRNLYNDESDMPHRHKITVQLLWHFW